MQERTSTSGPAYSIIEVVLGFLGAGIAGTLWWAHRSNVELPCTSGGGCDVVASSPWAHMTVGPWHDIPIALLGLLTYIVLLTLAMLKLGAERAGTINALRRLLWAGAALGMGYSWYLQYVAHFKLDAFCVWCFSSACVMTLLFLAATVESLAPRRVPPPPDIDLERTTTNA